MLTYLSDIILAFIVAIGFAVLFQTPTRVLHVAGLLGGLGHCIRFSLLSHDIGIIPATLAGTVFIGLFGIVLSHKVHTPPVVFTMPACITMIPGLFAYRAMLGCLKITDLEHARTHPETVTVTAHYFVLTACLLFTLAIGICIGALLFRKRSSKSLFKRIF
ncbi:MAG: threonine/serine exporter family protein [Verrucomicrobiota bacterium JB025]|nr:threonine/serine exporter family protein [Verrucomicrobiota bacterium JB025]